MAENATATLPDTADDNRAARLKAATERAIIDNSCRVPVLVFASFSLFWLLVGSLLAIIASTKLHWPGFTLNTPYDTFGRVRPAHLNTVAYGWATNAGIAVSLWLLARLSRNILRGKWILVTAACTLNLGVLAGTIGILAGYGTAIEWLEFPAYAPPIIAGSLAVIVAVSLTTFLRRREPHVYVSQWYIFAAFFWFPWLYTVANLLLTFAPVRGVVGASVNWWYGHNALGLWFTPIGLGAAYYLIPKVIGRPIHSYYLSIVGFWSLGLFYNWLGIHHLIGGPLPAWMQTASIVASVLMVIPVVAVAFNHHLTMMGYWHVLRDSPTLRFVVFGAMSYTLASVQGSLEAIRDFNVVVHFTHYTVGHAHLGLYAFFSMVMFGSLYYIVPRLTGTEWYNRRLISLHFWSTAIGITLYVLALSIGGWKQGWLMQHPREPGYEFIQTVLTTKPYLFLRTVGGTLMTLGHVVFTLLFVLNLLGIGQSREGATLFRERRKPTRQPLSTAATANT
jgi:cytochrome c oxidase cbb3-type subunit 1